MDSDFWNRLVSGHTQTTVPAAVDQRMSSPDFEGMRALTDVGRSAGALTLPVEAGVRVSFRGSVGALLSYENPPKKGAQGEVVTVRSATGDITSHDGRVFVKWDSGEFGGFHAQHLQRLASTAKQAAAGRDFLGKISKAIGEDGRITENVFRFGSYLASKKLPEILVVANVREAYKVWAKTRVASAQSPVSITQIRVASLGDLTSFLKVADSSLVHKSTKDLWSFKKDADGGLLVERLFDSGGSPLKGG